jgi:hypothetical protein
MLPDAKDRQIAQNAVIRWMNQMILSNAQKLPSQDIIIQ